MAIPNRSGCRHLDLGRSIRRLYLNTGVVDKLCEGIMREFMERRSGGYRCGDIAVEFIQEVKKDLLGAPVKVRLAVPRTAAEPSGRITHPSNVFLTHRFFPVFFNSLRKAR